MRSCSSDFHAVSSLPFTLAPCIVSTTARWVFLKQSLVIALLPFSSDTWDNTLSASGVLISSRTLQNWVFSVPHSYSGLNFHLRTLLFWEAFFRCLNPRWPCPPLNSPVSFSGLPSEKCVVTTHRIQYSWKTCSAKLLLLFPETWGDGVYAERSYY